MSRFVVTAEAKADLKQIRDFIAQDDAVAAKRQLTRLRQAFARLSRYPRLGHGREDVLTSSPVLFLPVGSYEVVYCPDTKPVTIIRVLHGGRDLAALLGNRGILPGSA